MYLDGADFTATELLCSYHRSFNEETISFF